MARQCGSVLLAQHCDPRRISALMAASGRMTQNSYAYEQLSLDDDHLSLVSNDCGEDMERTKSIITAPKLRLTKILVADT